MEFSKYNTLRALLIVFVLGFKSNAQKQSDIVEAFNEYNKYPREVAYLNLNKSTYVKGEDIGFTAYVFEKAIKRTSDKATNLYVSIEDENKKVVKQKLLKLVNGVASNVFNIDSSFTSGYYTVKAYTSWMRNFKEQDYFIETIRIIDPKVEQYIETGLVDSAIDAQFLPESGHLVDGIRNTVGVVLKDAKGYGLPNARGRVLDKAGNLMSEFQVNTLGIGRFLLMTEHGNEYTVKIDHHNNSYSFELDSAVEPLGVLLSIKELSNRILVNITTNQQSLEYLSGKAYTLTLHNGSAIAAQDIVFEGSTNITKAYPQAQLAAGINVFTLFNENNRPVAERLFFNYQGISMVKTKNVIAKAVRDSIALQIELGKIDPNLFNSLSVSVLPAETQSHNGHSSILSSKFLQPYLRGHIENADHYFTIVDDRTKFDMDNLLLTQGWSSYDWRDIMGEPQAMRFPFEQGITVKANINAENIGSDDTYIFRGPNVEPNVFKLPDGQKSFLVENVFISEKERIYISKIRNRSPSAPRLYLQAFPSYVPVLDASSSALRPKDRYTDMSEMRSDNLQIQSIRDVQQLDEVVVVTQRDKARIRAWELAKGRFGDVMVVTEEDRQAFFSLADYMRGQSGIRVIEGRTDVSFLTGRSISPNSGGLMDIFIDDASVGKSLPARFPLMWNVDYIVINRTGLGSDVGQGFKGTGGVIRIYTSPKALYSESSKTMGQAYELPLKFAANKTFYVPKYKVYNDAFYKNFGTIDWKPQIRIDANGNSTITIRKPQGPFKLFIEGIVNDVDHVLEEKTLSLN